MSPYFRLRRVSASSRSSIASRRPGSTLHAVPQRAQREQRILDLRAARVQRLDRRRRSAGSSRAEIREDTRGARASRPIADGSSSASSAATSASPLANRSACCSALALRAQLVLLARPQPRGVQLRDLKAQQVLALRAVALGRARPLDLVQRGPVLREAASATRSAQLLRLGEPIQEVELARGLEEPLVLVLTVHLDELIAQALEQRHRDRRVVDERPMPARARELAPDEDLAVADGSPASSSDRAAAAPARHLEARFDRRRVGVGADDVGLRARAAHEEDARRSASTCRRPSRP